jgi:hypothetical protein
MAFWCLLVVARSPQSRVEGLGYAAQSLQAIGVGLRSPNTGWGITLFPIAEM